MTMQMCHLPLFLWKVSGVSSNLHWLLEGILWEWANTVSSSWFFLLLFPAAQLFHGRSRFGHFCSFLCNPTWVSLGWKAASCWSLTSGTLNSLWRDWSLWVLYNFHNFLTKGLMLPLPSLRGRGRDPLVWVGDLTGTYCGTFLSVAHFYLSKEDAVQSRQWVLIQGHPSPSLCPGKLMFRRAEVLPDQKFKIILRASRRDSYCHWLV